MRKITLLMLVIVFTGCVTAQEKAAALHEGMSDSELSQIGSVDEELSVRDGKVVHLFIPGPAFQQGLDYYALVRGGKVIYFDSHQTAVTSATWVGYPIEDAIHKMGLYKKVETLPDGTKAYEWEESRSSSTHFASYYGSGNAVSYEYSCSITLFTDSTGKVTQNRVRGNSC